ncbi:MAG TPA: hypothetical protein VF173_26320 [Thermoanaerobaculia bacterium]|nr:hypothetical protein [Thermoanaerobaculia bacterium]
MTRLTRTALFAALSSILAVAVLEAASLFRFYRTQIRLPMWDMAGNGWGGAELLQALSAGRLFHFLNLLNHQDKWPFGYSLLLLPFLAAGGSSFAAATLLSTVLFALTPALLLWVAYEAEGGAAGIWGGLLAGALFLASPLPRVLAIVVLREMAGCAFSLLAIGLYLRARRLETAWAWRLTGLSLLALFLVKYNYCLILALVLLAAEIWRRWPLHLSWPGWSRGRVVLAIYLGLLLLAGLLGINPGVGVYAGLVVGSIMLAVRWRRDREGFARRWRELPLQARALTATVIVPLWLWCLSPNPVHPQSIYAFLHNRTTGPPLLSAESLLYYPREILRDYSPRPVVGLVVLTLVLVSPLALRRLEGARPIVLGAFLGLALDTLHPYKEPRFLATTVPFLFLAAALTLTRAAHALPRLGGALVGGVLSVAAIAAVSWTALHAGLDERVSQDYPSYSAPPAIWKPLIFLSRQAATVPRVAVIGNFNELSDSLVRWWLAQNEDTRQIVPAEPPGRSTATSAAELHRWLATERPDCILSLRLLPESPLNNIDYQRYNAWQLGVIDRLERDEGWREERRRDFEPLGIEAVVLVHGPPSGSGNVPASTLLLGTHGAEAPDPRRRP